MMLNNQRIVLIGIAAIGILSLFVLPFAVSSGGHSLTLFDPSITLDTGGTIGVAIMLVSFATAILVALVAGDRNYILEPAGNAIVILIGIANIAVAIYFVAEMPSGLSPGIGFFIFILAAVGTLVTPLLGKSFSQPNTGSHEKDSPPSSTPTAPPRPQRTTYATAKLCANCGTKAESGATVCRSCGSLL